MSSGAIGPADPAGPEDRADPETPRPETPRPETPRPETPRPETPRPETPRPETPRPETPRPGVRRPGAHRSAEPAAAGGERNVLGGPLEVCGFDPLTGYFRDGSCTCGPADTGAHTVCVVVTAEFLAHQRRTGNDLGTPLPAYGFPGLTPGDRWCVVAVRWMHAYLEGAAAPVVLAATNVKALEVIPLAALRENAVDVPADVSSLE